jgi:serine phosphatase RsbU (regulator of sigma subunit)/FixJ family two-component response regulator
MRREVPRTLIADDQPDVLEALSLLLKREGHQTRTAASPLAVLSAIRSQNFDLLLMDLNYARDTTSGLEGLDLLARIRDLDSTLPVVVMTAWGSVELAVEAMHRGVGDFVQKPWDNARLLSILRSQIERGRASRRTRRLEASLASLADRIPQAGGAQSLIEMVEEQLREALASPAVRIGPHDGAAGLEFPVRHGDDLFTSIQVAEKPGGEAFDDEERAYLAEVAARLGLGLSELQRRENERDIAAACEIQRGFLPSEIPQIRGFTMAGHWQPARVVSGDYYDVLRFDDDHAALCIADVVGKGLPAALLMSNLQAAVKACATSTTPPRDLCARVNRIICGNIAPDRFISLFYGLLDGSTGRFVYAGAGHNAPILLRRDGTHQRLSSHGRVLGVSADWSCRQAEVALEPGDRLVLFTDGVTEARNDRDEEFGEQRLISIVTRDRHRAPGAIQDEIVKALAAFCPAGIQDDATLLTVAVHEDGKGV